MNYSKRERPKQTNRRKKKKKIVKPQIKPQTFVVMCQKGFAQVVLLHDMTSAFSR
jgi:hypothetical protein